MFATGPLGVGGGGGGGGDLRFGGMDDDPWGIGAEPASHLLQMINENLGGRVGRRELGRLLGNNHPMTSGMFRRDQGGLDGSGGPGGGGGGGGQIGAGGRVGGAVMSPEESALAALASSSLVPQQHRLLARNSQSTGGGGGGHGNGPLSFPTAMAPPPPRFPTGSGGAGGLLGGGAARGLGHWASMGAGGLGGEGPPSGAMAEIVFVDPETGGECALNADKYPHLPCLIVPLLSSLSPPPCFSLIILTADLFSSSAVHSRRTAPIPVEALMAAGFGGPGAQSAALRSSYRSGGQPHGGARGLLGSQQQGALLAPPESFPSIFAPPNAGGLGANALMSQYRGGPGGGAPGSDPASRIPGESSHSLVD